MIVTNPVAITENEIETLARAARGKITRIFLHWTGGHYGQPYDEYHLCVDKDGQVYGHCDDLTEFKEHTWLRNHGSVAISLCCGEEGRCWLPDNCNARTTRAEYAGEPNNDPDAALIRFGPEPPTVQQIEVMAKVTAILCNELGLPITKDTVQTHCEIAFRDGYGPGSSDPYMKWDLWFLPDAMKDGALVPGGALLRGKAIFYQELMKCEKKLA